MEVISWNTIMAFKIEDSRNTSWYFHDLWPPLKFRGFEKRQRVARSRFCVCVCVCVCVLLVYFFVCLFVVVVVFFLFFFWGGGGRREIRPGNTSSVICLEQSVEWRIKLFSFSVNKLWIESFAKKISFSCSQTTENLWSCSFQQLFATP